MAKLINGTIFVLVTCGSSQLLGEPATQAFQPPTKLKSEILSGRATFNKQTKDIITYSQYCGGFGSMVAEKFTQIRAEFQFTKARVIQAITKKNKAAIKEVIYESNAKIQESQPQLGQAYQALSDPNPY